MIRMYWFSPPRHTCLSYCPSIVPDVCAGSLTRAGDSWLSGDYVHSSLGKSVLVKIRDKGYNCISSIHSHLWDRRQVIWTRSQLHEWHNYGTVNAATLRKSTSAAWAGETKARMPNSRSGRVTLPACSLYSPFPLSLLEGALLFFLCLSQ